MIKKTIIIFLLSLFLISCSPQLNRLEETKLLMGTTVAITVIDKDNERAKNAISAAFDEINRVERLFSIYINDSQISILNNNGFLENADSEVIFLINKSIYYSELSNGAFDITVQPILDLYKKSFEELKRPPTEEEINKTKKLIGYKNIMINDSIIYFSKKNMKITLGGIAKGYAVDKAIEVLEKNGIKNALVNAGGDIRVIGKKENDLWNIALENPRNKGEFITIIKIIDESVTTSGDYERYFDEAKKFHHIINPKTGYSATELISATIIAKTATDADALATAVFVLGPEKGLELIEKLDDVEGLLITKDKKIIKSSNLSRTTHQRWVE